MGHEISIIIPTITGRESWVDKCLSEYKLTAPDAEYIVIKDEPSCGHAWQKGYAQSTRPFIHFTADDITPAESNWMKGALDMLRSGIVPGANVVDGRVTDSIVKLLCDSPLGELGRWPNILVPFLTREMLEMGGWLLPIHYGSDDWVTYKAVKSGFQVQRCMEYRMAHHVADEGRNYRRRHGDVKALVVAMEAAGYVPPVYEQLEINLRTSETGLDSVSLSQLDSRKDEEARRAARVERAAEAAQLMVIRGLRSGND